MQCPFSEVKRSFHLIIATRTSFINWPIAGRRSIIFFFLINKNCSKEAHRKQLKALFFIKNLSMNGTWSKDITHTPPRPSEISEKSWSTTVKPFLTSHLWYKAMLKVWRKSWEPFRIYQLTSTANLAKICEIGLDWRCYLKVPFFQKIRWGSKSFEITFCLFLFCSWFSG